MPLVLQPVEGCLVTVHFDGEKIIEVKFSDEEKAKFAESVAAARSTNAKLGDALK